MLDERGKPCCHRLGQTRTARSTKRAREQQRARVVVDAIAMRTVGYRMNSMLQQSCAVAHGEQMIGFQRRNDMTCRPDTIPDGRRVVARLGRFACGFECREIALGGLLPCHRPARRIGPPAHAIPTDIVYQQCGDLRAYGLRIPKRNQNATPIIEQLPSVPVGRRDDRLTQAEAVGERARRHLGFIEIGRHIEVAHRDEFEQLGLVDELVDEDDVTGDAEGQRPCRQFLSIRFSLIADEVGMRRAENDVDGVGTGLDDSRHGIDHGLDAFARRKKTERQDDGFSAKPQSGFCGVRFPVWKIGYAVGNNLDLFGRHAMHSL